MLLQSETKIESDLMLERALGGGMDQEIIFCWNKKIRCGNFCLLQLNIIGSFDLKVFR